MYKTELMSLFLFPLFSFFSVTLLILVFGYSFPCAILLLFDET